MKKTILLILVTFFSFQGFAQDPDLYQTWYLSSYEYDLGDIYYVSDITPHIFPELTIDESLGFTGIACETYEGNFIYNTSTDLLYLEFFDLCLCGTCISPPQSHIDFENNYYAYFEIGREYYYDIYNVTPPDGDLYQELILHAYPGFELHYQNIPVLFSVDNNFINQVTVYPNPVSEKLFISSKNIIINKLTVYSVSGKKVLEQINSQSDAIDVSNLSRGIYFLEAVSGNNKSIKKFIKQ